jgi:hypothetical protein
MKLRSAVVILFSIIACMHTAQGTQQQQDAFAAAVRNQSTSPSYVKIQVGQLTGSLSTNCVTANLFLGAIHIEHGLPYTEKGLASAEQIANSSPSHAFRFAKPAALANLP